MKSYRFATTFEELLNSLVELLYGERHDDPAAQYELLSLGVLQLGASERCSRFLAANKVLAQS